MSENENAGNSDEKYKKLENAIFGDTDEELSDYEEAVKERRLERKSYENELRKIQRERQEAFRMKKAIPKSVPIKKKKKSVEVENKEPVGDPKLAEFHQDFEAALRQIKTKRHMNDFDEVEQDEYVISLRILMIQAAQKDMELNDNNKPATEKLKLLGIVLETLENKILTEKLLENHILEPIKLWLEPLNDGSLPNINVRKALLVALAKLPIEIEHLRESGLGKIVMFYSKLPRELAEIRKVAANLISTWSRPILGFSVDYRDLNQFSTFIDVKMKRANSDEKGSTEMRPHARIPRQAYFDFVKQPESTAIPTEKVVSEQYKKMASHLQRLKKQK